MHCSFRSLLTFGFASLAGTVAYAGKTPDTAYETHICIRVYDLSHVQPRTLAWAILQTNKIFKKADIGIVWEQPSADSPEAHFFDLSSSSLPFPSLSNRPRIVVRIKQPTPAAVSPGALGFAVPFGRSGINVELFWDRIQAEAQSNGVAAYIILAYAMAHEIGHVLLGSSDHSPAGIMLGRWNAETWRMGSFGLLAFLPQQASSMRANCQILMKGSDP